jgi:hypothetical protein
MNKSGDRHPGTPQPGRPHHRVHERLGIIAAPAGRFTMVSCHVVQGWRWVK